MKKTTSALMGTIFLVILMAVFIANIIIPEKTHQIIEKISAKIGIFSKKSHHIWQKAGKTWYFF